MRLLTIMTLILGLCVFLLNGPAVGKTQSDFNRIELKNGLTIITKDIKSSPLLSINIFVRAGSKDETVSTEGITHFCEHLFFRGTRSATGVEFKSSLESMGGVCNAETTKDYTRYYLNIPARHGMKGLKLMLDALQNAAFNEEEIEQERKVIIEEYKMTRESLMGILADGMYEMAFQEHPYRNPIIGTEKNLKSFKRADFLGFRQHFYSPEKLIFVIVGNCDEVKTIQAIVEAFKDIPPYAGRENTLPVEKKQTEIREKTIFKGYDRTILVMGFHGPSVSDRQYIYATDLLCFMLGTGNSSILNRDLVTEKNLVKDISVNFLTQRDPGLIIIDASLKSSKDGPPGGKGKPFKPRGRQSKGQEPQPKDKNVEDVKQEILQVLKKVASGEFGEEDITRARNLLVNSYIFGSETNAGEASNFGFYEAIDSSEFARTYVRNVKKVKKEDLIAAAQKYLSGPYCSLIVKPDPKLRMMEEEEDEEE